MKTKYPILLVHGMGFRDRKILNYWGRIPKALKKNGNKVYYGNQDANGRIEDNAIVLKDRINQIISETGCEKVNVIAHSKGGLDIRYAVSHFDLEDKVASITTMQTPHNGSKTVDLLLKFPDGMVRLVAKIADFWLKLLGDEKPMSYEVFHSLTTNDAKEFNSKNIISEKVYGQSYAFLMKNAFSDIFLFFPYLVVRIIEGKSDGLLTPEAVKWGDFRGVVKSNTNRGISHCDEVDMRRHRFSKKDGAGVSDIVDFYIDVVEELAEKGY